MRTLILAGLTLTPSMVLRTCRSRSTPYFLLKTLARSLTAVTQCVVCGQYIVVTVELTGYSVGAASAKQRLDMVIRNAINSGTIPGPRYLANGQEVCLINYPQSYSV